MLKEVLAVKVGQLNHDTFPKKCRSIAKDFDLKCDVQYLNMTFGFPFNTCHYKVCVEGEAESITNFKSFMGIEDTEDSDGSLWVPILAGVVFIGMAIAIGYISTLK